MRLYNTLSRREEPFTPSQGNTVRMYTCGLTVYARGHIGNFRTFVALDVLRRALEFNGYTVQQVRNYTDVDDRTIVESIKAGAAAARVHAAVRRRLREDAAALGLETVEFAPRATDRQSPAMAGMIHALEQNGHTYASDGSIYFKISTFPEYGKLARLDHGGIKSGARVDSDKYEKEDARDFVLWKASKPGEPSWDAGPARRPPRLAHRVLGDGGCELLGELPIDIHGGGVDLIFPHHENEIAQAEGATRRQFSRFWVHVEHLMIEEEQHGTEKMSKSLGNVYNLEDVVAQGFRPSALRYLYLGTHYRKQLKFSWALLAQVGRSAQADHRLPGAAGHAARGPRQRRRRRRASRRRRRPSPSTSAPTSTPPAALGVVFDLVRALNSSIDAGELHDERRGGRARHLRRVRSRARRAVAAPRRRRASAGAGRRDRAAHPGAPRRARRAATSPKPIESGRTSTPAASSSKTPPPGRAGRRK